MESLGTERLRSTYQTTFFWERGAPPCGVAERAIARLFDSLPGASAAIGAEWWLSRMRTSNVKVDFHRDCDEVLFRTTGRVVHPLSTNVLFLNTCRGGALAVSARRPVEQNPAMAPSVLDFDLVEPAPNRMASLGGRVTHGVLDSHNQLPFRWRRRERSLRLALIINVWKRRPIGALDFGPSGHYAKLR